MNKIFFSLLLSSLLFSGCGLNNRDAYKFNQSLVDKESALEPFIVKTEANVARFYAAKEYDSIALAGKNMEQLIDDKIQEIEKNPAPNVKDGKEFKEAFIKYLSYFKNVYNTYKNFGNATTEEDRNAALLKINELLQTKPSVLTEIKARQKKYAADNNFKLEKGN